MNRHVAYTHFYMQVLACKHIVLTIYKYRGVFHSKKIYSQVLHICQNTSLHVSSTVMRNGCLAACAIRVTTPPFLPVITDAHADFIPVVPKQRRTITK